MDEPDAQRGRGVEEVAGQQDPARPRGTDRLHESGGRRQRVDDAELCRRDAEAGVVATDAQVAGHGHLRAATDRKAFDRRDRRLGEGDDRLLPRLHGFAVPLRTRRISAQ